MFICLCPHPLGRSVRFADMPPEAPRDGKRKKKRLVKKTKAITPLQAMMLRMAGMYSLIITLLFVIFTKLAHCELLLLVMRHGVCFPLRPIGS